MKFIEQPYHSKKCGQACLAMITGKTVEEICSALENNWSTSMDRDIQRYLNRNDFSTSITYNHKLSFEKIPNNSIIRVCYPNEAAHFVVKHKDKIYDPSVGIIDQMLAYVKITHYLTYEKRKSANKNAKENHS